MVAIFMVVVPLAAIEEGMVVVEAAPILLGNLDANCVGNLVTRFVTATTGSIQITPIHQKSNSSRPFSPKHS